MTTRTLPVIRSHGYGPPREPRPLRLGTAALVAGLLSQVPLGALHPHREYANDSVAAFHEYARSGDWVLVHLGQFLGLMLATIGLVAMATYLGRQRGPAGFLGQVAVVTAVVSAAVFAVQMAVDGVALKAAVDAWDAATATADRSAAYRVAESVRSVEKGLSALFNLINGLTLLSLGLGLSMGSGRGRRLGWIAAVAGVGFVAVGVLTARTGFSHEATSAALPATGTLVVFAVGMAFAGRHEDHTDQGAAGLTVFVGADDPLPRGRVGLRRRADERHAGGGRLASATSSVARWVSPSSALNLASPSRARMVTMWFSSARARVRTSSSEFLSSVSAASRHRESSAPSPPPAPAYHSRFSLNKEMAALPSPVLLSSRARFSLAVAAIRPSPLAVAAARVRSTRPPRPPGGPPAAGLGPASPGGAPPARGSRGPSDSLAAPARARAASSKRCSACAMPPSIASACTRPQESPMGVRMSTASAPSSVAVAVSPSISEP